MSIHHNQPTIDLFKKNEVKTLEYLTTRGGLLKNFPNLSQTVNLAYYNFHGKRNQRAFDFLFHADFEMTVEKSSHKIIVGANVTGTYSLCSYFFAIAGNNEDENRLIRKFHFDFALPSTNVRQPVPVYHLQYGGKISPEIEKMGLTSEKLDHWLSLPRLNFPPVNLAIMLDILFCELRVEETREIVESDDWRALIYDNERFLSKNYFDNIHNHVNSRAYRKELLIRDFCYGKT